MEPTCPSCGGMSVHQYWTASGTRAVLSVEEDGDEIRVDDLDPFDHDDNDEGGDFHCYSCSTTFDNFDHMLDPCRYGDCGNEYCESCYPPRSCDDEDGCGDDECETCYPSEDEEKDPDEDKNYPQNKGRRGYDASLRGCNCDICCTQREKDMKEKEPETVLSYPSSEGPFTIVPGNDLERDLLAKLFNFPWFNGRMQVDSMSQGTSVLEVLKKELETGEVLA